MHAEKVLILASYLLIFLRTRKTFFCKIAQWQGFLLFCAKTPRRIRWWFSSSWGLVKGTRVLEHPCWPPGSGCSRRRRWRSWRTGRRYLWRCRGELLVWPGCSRWSETKPIWSEKKPSLLCVSLSSIGLTLVRLLDSSLMVNPAQRTSPRV